MSKWTFWEWVAYAALFVAAVVVAADQGIKLEPDLLRKMDGVVSNPIWGFSPVALVLLATAVLIGHEFGWIGKDAEDRDSMPLRNSLAPRSPARGTLTPQEIDRRVFVNVEPEFLMEIFVSHTQVQAEKLLESYIGKWMKISARVFNVRSYGKGSKRTITVSLHRGERIPGLFTLEFESEWTERVEILRRDENLTAIGKIANADRAGVRLENCEPVSD